MNVQNWFYSTLKMEKFLKNSTWRSMTSQIDDVTNITILNMFLIDRLVVKI